MQKIDNISLLYLLRNAKLKVDKFEKVKNTEISLKSLLIVMCREIYKDENI